MIHILSAKSKFKILSYCYSSISKLPNDTKLSNIQNLYPLIKKIQSQNILKSHSKQQILNQILNHLEHSSIYANYKISKYFHLQNWNKSDHQKISKLLFKLINKSTHTKKECFYIIKMLNQYNYILDKQQDQIFIENLKNLIRNSLRKNLYFMAISMIDKEIYKQIFNIYQVENFCQFLIQNIQNSKYAYYIADFYKKLVFNGMINNFWSETINNNNFYIQNKLSMRLYKNLILLLQFNKANPVEYTYKKNFQSSKTEVKIGNYLEILGYNFIKNVFIYNRQIDFLINNNIILEYNGYHHYAINKQNQMSIYQKYRILKFSKMGYKIVTINSMQWEKLQYKQRQLQYLVKKIETAALQDLTDIKN